MSALMLINSRLTLSSRAWKNSTTVLKSEQIRLKQFRLDSHLTSVCSSNCSNSSSFSAHRCRDGLELIVLTVLITVFK